MLVIYSRDSCAPCATLKLWLRRKGIAFEERPPDDSIPMVPTIDLNGERIVGLNFPRLAELLDKEPQNAA